MFAHLDASKRNIKELSMHIRYKKILQNSGFAAADWGHLLVRLGRISDSPMLQWNTNCIYRTSQRGWF